MLTPARHHNSRNAADSFLRALFSSPGMTLRWADITTRAAASQIHSSSAVINDVAQQMVRSGFLESPRRGVYRRPEPAGVPLGIPEPAAPSAQSVDLVRLAGLHATLLRVEAKLDQLLALQAPAAPAVQS